MKSVVVGAIGKVGIALEGGVLLGGHVRKISARELSDVTRRGISRTTGWGRRSKAGWVLHMWSIEVRRLLRQLIRSSVGDAPGRVYKGGGCQESWPVMRVAPVLGM